MGSFSEEDKRQLSVELFELTGLKVDPSDPIVTAALFYTARLRQAGELNTLDIRALHSQLREDVRTTLQAAVGQIERASQQSVAKVLSEFRDAGLSQGNQVVPPIVATPVIPAGDMHSSVRVNIFVAVIFSAIGFVAGLLWQQTISGGTVGRNLESAKVVKHGPPETRN